MTYHSFQHRVRYSLLVPEGLTLYAKLLGYIGIIFYPLKCVKYSYIMCNLNQKECQSSIRSFSFLEGQINRLDTAVALRGLSAAKGRTVCHQIYMLSGCQGHGACASRTSRGQGAINAPLIGYAGLTPARCQTNVADVGLTSRRRYVPLIRRHDHNAQGSVSPVLW